MWITLNSIFFSLAGLAWSKSMDKSFSVFKMWPCYEYFFSIGNLIFALTAWTLSRNHLNYSTCACWICGDFHLSATCLTGYLSPHIRCVILESLLSILQKHAWYLTHQLCSILSFLSLTPFFPNSQVKLQCPWMIHHLKGLDECSL